jgi:hypothetical protein
VRSATATATSAARWRSFAEQPPQVALQRPAVALDDRLEGAIVAVGGKHRQTAIALRAQERRGQQGRHDR